MTATSPAPLLRTGKDPLNLYCHAFHIPGYPGNRRPVLGIDLPFYGWSEEVGRFSSTGSRALNTTLFFVVF